MKLNNLFAIGFATTMLLASCGGKEKPKTPTTDTTKTDTTAVDTTAKTPSLVNIVETAKSDSNLSTLVELLTTAGLVETLSDEAVKYTVFAPTNEAFNKLGDKKLTSLKEEKNKEQLKDILTYHVVSGEMAAADVQAKTELIALNEKAIKVTVKDGKTMVGTSNITATDIKASNGTIHLIDAVMTPPSKKSTTTKDQNTTVEVKTDIKTTEVKTTDTKKK